jgi:catechol 2,3-dioxygenase-like lactoylglutathione lyase family enzyme
LRSALNFQKMIHFTRFDHVMLVIPVGSTAAARAFYGDLLKLPEIPGEHPKGALWFQVANIELHLREEELSSSGVVSSRHPAFEVANLAEARQWLAQQGVALEPASPIDGRERFFIRDPFGNRLELLQFAPAG